MIPYGIFERVFLIGFREVQGTCFAIEYQEKQYLVTAAHLLEGIKDKDEIQLRRSKDWMTVGVQVVGVDYGNDIAVLAAETQLCYAYGVIIDAVGLSVGHDMYFLGFPYNLHVVSDPPNGAVDNDFPMAYTKRAMVSAIRKDGKYVNFILDGHNNDGFSGGPACFQRREDTKIIGSNLVRQFRVASVVCGFISRDQPVLLHGKPLKAVVEENTGLIRTIGMVLPMRMIIDRPIGARISNSGSPFEKEDQLRRHRHEEFPPEKWLE